MDLAKLYMGNPHEPKIRAEAHARKMKAISFDISFMGNPHEALPHTRRMKNLMNPQILLLSMGSEG